MWGRGHCAVYDVTVVIVSYPDSLMCIIYNAMKSESGKEVQHFGSVRPNQIGYAARSNAPRQESITR